MPPVTHGGVRTSWQYMCFSRICQGCPEAIAQCAGRIQDLPAIGNARRDRGADKRPSMWNFSIGGTGAWDHLGEPRGGVWFAGAVALGPDLLQALEMLGVAGLPLACQLLRLAVPEV